MSKVVQAAEFFVVGSPVQPDRPCYVERAADRALEAAIRARESCCVLGARAIGKTSLTTRVTRTLRQAGGLAAIVDLAQLGARGGDAEHWIYGIAHRVVHDLHIEVDLPAWWREQTALAPENRLADFFWEVVLTNTTAPVTVFFDKIEQALLPSFGRELLAAIETCHLRREREADYGRLCFVLLGVAAREQLGATPTTPLLAQLRSIELADFTTDEAYVLALGFGGERAQAQALMDRVCVWTQGQPYLTQKVARGVARKGGKLEDVERVVREQLLLAGAVSDDPLLSHARAVLTRREPTARRALKLLRRIARGAQVVAPKDSDVCAVLELSGVVARDAAGLLRYRNRVVRDVFGVRWVKSVAPAGWRTWAAVAALAVAAALGGYAYLNFLPVPYERVLASADADSAAIDAAYRGLHRFPGFAARADRLLADALRRRSGSATNVNALVNADTQLRTLPGQNELADRLLADFWLRKVTAAVDAEQRDAALLFALRAAAAAGDAASARAWVGELAGEDHRRLERTVRLPAAAVQWAVDWQEPAVLSLGANDVQRTPLAAGSAPAPPTLRLSALRHTALERDLRVEGEGSAGQFELSVALAHPASAELALTLTAPSGAQATLRLPQNDAGASASYVFAAQEGLPLAELAELADEERRGTWRLTIVDGRVDNTGTLGGWGLRFGAEGWRDDPAEGIAIPDPQRTEAVTVAFAADNAFAIVQPAERGAIGSVGLWDLAAGRLAGDFMPALPPQNVVLNAAATRLLISAPNLATLWNVADGTPVARLATQTEFVLPPAFSSDGGYVAIAERVEDSPPLYSLLRAADGSLLASVEGIAGTERWWLGPGARYFALLGPSNQLRIVDARSGEELRRFQHARPVARVLPLPDGVALITIDAAGEIRAWRVDGASAAAGRRLGTAAAADGVSVSGDGARIAYPTGSGEIVVRDVASGARLITLRDEGGTAPQRTQLAPDGARLVAASGERGRLWSLPSTGATAERATDLDVTALYVAPESDVVLLGFRGGELRLSDGPNVARAAVASSRLDYFGHRGAVSALAIDAARGVAVTGGADGIVRVWDLANMEPVTPVLAHSVVSDDATILAVALSADARWIASAAAGTVRLWSAADGELATELPFAGSTATLAFAPDTALLAIGDRDGVRLVPLASSGGSTRAQTARAAITAIAFAPGREYYASGNAAGDLQLARVASGESVGVARTLPSGIRWIGFGGDGVLIAATGAWVHSYAVSPAGLEPLHSRRLQFAELPVPALAAVGQERVRIAGFDIMGALRSLELDLGAALDPALAPPAEVLERDWPAALGLHLDERGETALADP